MKEEPNMQVDHIQYLLARIEALEKRNQELIDIITNIEERSSSK